MAEAAKKPGIFTPPKARCGSTAPKNKCDELHWQNYMELARKLERAFPKTQLMTLKKDQLLAMVQTIENFVDKHIQPTRAILDDIRFAWFFLRTERGKCTDINDLNEIETTGNIDKNKVN